MRPAGDGRTLYLYGGLSPMRPGVLAVLRAHGFHPVSTPLRADVVAGWGTRLSGERASARAARTGQSLLRLEDAFLRSAGLGAWGAPPLGLIADPLGIYYDASARSLIEARLASDWSMGAAEKNDALDQLARFNEFELTKYALPRLGLEAPDGPYTLVIDQTAGDESIARGFASSETFETMLREALEESGDPVLVRTHPDVLAGAKRGHLAPADIERMGIRSDRIRHHVGGALRDLFAGAVRVHAVTSLGGFEARLAGCAVAVHGLPFYAGWGEAGDRMGSERRTQRRTPIEIFAAAYRDLPLYLNPHTDEATSFERTMHHVAALRAEAERRAVPTHCFGMHLWKHGFVSAHLGGAAPGAFPPDHVRQHRTSGEAIAAAREQGGRVGYWAAKTSEADRRAVTASGSPHVEIEDGFLRSKGLGAHFTVPGSLALDTRGIYYDPTRPSDLEAIIEAGAFDEALLARADAWIEAFRAGGLTKYNLVETNAPPEAPPGRKSVLVLGQVEDDASIRVGATGAVRTNAALIEAAREAHLDAFLVYRPHPDVERRRRRGAVPEDRLALADAVSRRAPLPALMERADHVHVITSLGGLEALMHGCAVTCHGMPFFAGWGLTEDRAPVPARRTRKAMLNEVVAAAYLAYPSTVDPVTSLFVTPERLAERIAATRPWQWNVLASLVRQLDRRTRHWRRT